MRILTRALMAVVVGLTAVVALATPAHATAITYVRTANWATGYVAEITVTNNFSIPITGWEVGFDLLPGTTIASFWSSRVAATAPHNVYINATWNGALAPGAFVKWGFVATGVDDPVFLWP